MKEDGYYVGQNIVASGQFFVEFASALQDLNKSGWTS